MAEYIERKKLKEAFDNADPDVYESYPDGYGDWGFGRENVRDVIRGVPAADVAPVVHGKWITRSDKGIISMTHPYMCSRCWRAEMNKEPYCNCGAKME